MASILLFSISFCLLWNQNSYEVIVFWSDFFCDCNVSTSTTHNISKCNFEALWEILLLNISWKFYLVAFGTQSNFSFYTVVLMRKVNFPGKFSMRKNKCKTTWPSTKVHTSVRYTFFIFFWHFWMFLEDSMEVFYGNKILKLIVFYTFALISGP